MYIRRAIRAADPADSHVQARTAPQNRRQKHLRPPDSLPRETTTRAPPSRILPHARHAQAHKTAQQASYTCRIPLMRPPCTSRRPAPPGQRHEPPGTSSPDASSPDRSRPAERHTRKEPFCAPVESRVTRPGSRAAVTPGTDNKDHKVARRCSSAAGTLPGPRPHG